jgi:hypothetical protein
LPEIAAKILEEADKFVLLKRKAEVECDFYDKKSYKFRKFFEATLIVNETVNH